jgi:hypothetical protein
MCSVTRAKSLNGIRNTDTPAGLVLQHLIGALSGLAQQASSLQRTLDHGFYLRHESNFHEHGLFSGHLAPQGVEKASVGHGTPAPR